MLQLPLHQTAAYKFAATFWLMTMTPSIAHIAFLLFSTSPATLSAHTALCSSVPSCARVSTTCNCKTLYDFKHSDLNRPQADYRQPYVRGTNDRLKTALEGMLFNNRKTSGVFNSGACLYMAAHLHNAACHRFQSIAGDAKMMPHPSAVASACLCVQPLSCCPLHAAFAAVEASQTTVLAV